MAKSKHRNVTTWKKGDPNIPRPAAHNQVRYRDEFLQILIAQLNEVDEHTSKEKKYLLIERLLAMGIGLEVRIGTRKVQFEPSLPAMKEIFDRFLGKPRQAVDVGVDEGKSGVLIVFDEPGDSDL
jgi:hypothetical protein